jgi:hypothetical protein
MPHHFFHENAPMTGFTLARVEGDREVGNIMAKMRQFAAMGGLNVEEGRGNASAPTGLRV